MVLVGPMEMESIFGELEAELGEEITHTVVEAQKRFVKSVLREEEIGQGVDYLTRQIALRGMGNLVEFEFRKEGLDAVVDNASPHLLVAGMLQGIFEALTGDKSSCGYVLEKDGSLAVSVKKI